MPNAPLLQMKQISKLFPGVQALKKVDFTVQHSEIHGLIGENGAGKSTLMNVLMGIYKPEEGEVFVNGKKAVIHNPTQAIQLGIGLVPQELNLNPYVSAAENIFLGNENKTRFGAMDWNKTNRKAKEVLATIGCHIDPKTPVHKLSVAQQQLVQIARVLATGASLLVFDEPTASLTKTEADFLLNLMGQLKEEGKSIVFITHHLEELLVCTDKISVMRDGKMVHVSETKDITMEQLIEHMAGQKVKKHAREQREVGEDVLLRVEGFGRKNEFENVSFDVKKGEIFGIGGLIGSGRTELVNAITGNTRKEAGTLFFEGQAVDIKSPPQAIKLGIGYVPEERRSHGIFSILPVYENMLLPIYPNLFKRGVLQYKEAAKISKDYVQQINIKTPTVQVPIANLSGGNQQKVILARWLAKKTKLLILDEPTRGIDVNAKSEIYDLIRTLSQEGLTVIMISSEHEELLLLTDRVMIMFEGEVKGIKNTVDLKEQDILEVALK